MDKSENPYAFPVSTIDGFTQHGATLRDYFAGQALAGIAQSGDYVGRENIAAFDAYKFSDAMLAERSKS